MKTRKSLFCVMAMAAVALLLRTPISAAAQDDPPGRVARINLVQGNVSFQPSGGGDNDWVAAELNRPVTIGDRIWADSDGLAELHVGSTAIRLNHGTGISFLNLSDDVVQLQLSAGSIYVHVRRLESDDAFEVDTPNLAFSLLQPGIYRIDVDADNNVTVVTVREGQGEVTGGGRSWNLISDQQATFTGADYLNYNLEDADSLPQSDFDNWSFSRDGREDRVASVQYVSPDTTGYEDLDQYGSWDTVGGYGPMWFPSGVAMGWAPYRFGHWVFILPWGWTWVDSAPWGFAPFHYGRWASVGGRWGWAPGPLVGGVRCVYAPALVAWVGGGPGFGVSVAFGVSGGVAWFPLGPREVYSPWYRVSDDYVLRVNVTNTFVERGTVISFYHSSDDRNLRYMNQRVGGAVTVVDHDTFVNGRSVDRNAVRVSQHDIANAAVYRGGPTFQPEHNSMVGDARHSDRRPPAAVENRTVVAKRTPPSPTYVRQENNGGNRGGNEGTNRGGQPYNANGGNNSYGPRGGYNNSGGNYNPPPAGNVDNNPNGERGRNRNGEGNNNPPPADNNPNGNRGPNNNAGGNNNPPPAGDGNNNPNGGRGPNNNAGGNNNPPPAGNGSNNPNGGRGPNNNAGGNNNPPPAGNGSNNSNGGRGPNNNAGGNNNPPPAGNNGGNSPNGGRGPSNNAGGNYNPPPPPADNNGNNPNGQGGNYRGRGNNNPPSNQPSGGNSNSNPGSQPIVRPTPPVHQPTPEEQQTDNNRQQQWQDRHQQAHGNPPPATPPPANPPPANPPAASTPPANSTPPKSNGNGGNNSNSGNNQGSHGGDNHDKPPHR